MDMKKPTIIAFDLEGTLMPEMWIEVADHTGIDALRKTTADTPDYDALMKLRIDALREHKVTFSDICEVLKKTQAYEGARELLEWVRTHTGVQPVIISDTFYQFSVSVMHTLGEPMIFCNTLTIGSDGFIEGYERRQEDQKRAVVKSLKAMNFNVITIGDSFNDTTMFEEADAAAFFRAGDKVKGEFPQYDTFENYEELKEFISSHL